MPHGFRRKADLNAATANARHGRPPVIGAPPIPFEGRIWIVEVPVSGIAARTSGSQASKTTCDVKYIAEGGQLEDMSELGDTTTPTQQTIDVYNPWNIGYTYDPDNPTYVLVFQCGGRPTVMTNFSDTGAKLCTFYIQTPVDATTKIGEGVVVEALSSDANNGDVIKLYDPSGVWIDLDPDAHGVAIYAGNVPDSEGEPGATQPGYLIVDADRSIEKYRVKITDALVFDSTVSALVDWNDKTNRDVMPYGFDPAGPLQDEIYNPLRYHAVADSYIWIARYWEGDSPYARAWYVCGVESPHAKYLLVDVIADDIAPTYQVRAVGTIDGVDPYLGTSFYVDMSATPLYQQPLKDYWRCMLRYNFDTNSYVWFSNWKYKARWIHGTWTVPGNVTPDYCTTVSITLSPDCTGRTYWDGENPGSAVPAYFQTPNKPACDSPQTYTGVAQYVRESDIYVVRTTGAALMGTPSFSKVPKSGTMSLDCSTDGTVCIEAETALVASFDCQGETQPGQEPDKEKQICVTGKELLDCANLCEYICNYCDVYSVEECDPPPPPGECCGDCLFTSIGSVTVGGIGGSNYTQTTACCWTFDIDGGSGEVCYTGGGAWSVTIEGSASRDGTYNIAGDCSGGTGFVDPHTVSVAASGSVCETPPACCQDCLIRELKSVTTPGGGNSVSINRTDDCCWSVDISGEVGGPRTITVCYEGGGDWNVDGTVINGSCSSAAGGGGYSITADAEFCTPETPCCDFSNDAFIRNLSGQSTSAPIVYFSQKNASDPISSGGACGARATFPITYSNTQDPEQEGTAQLTLEYDDVAGCCRWNVVISGTDMPQGGNPSGSAKASVDAAPLSCEGTFANTSTPCGDMGTLGPTSFEVVDPTNQPACGPPGAFVATSAAGIGSMLRRLHPELFGAGCGCGDIANLLNGQTPDQAERNVDRYAVALQNEAIRTGLHSLNIDEIRLRIRNAIHAETERLNRQA